ncbi:hypothetical protein [Methanobacterium subterraneum]|nr:hypothetical protein [Methanobacterium subterraneum]
MLICLEVIDKKLSLRDVTFKKCGKTFKTDRDTDMCFRCKRGH